ncbi:MAG TPA: hypothetical protein VHL78_06075 [Actinomycetota bacterium]|nr:hypothetical protein [Actinomycetota bacterium]
MSRQTALLVALWAIALAGLLVSAGAWVLLWRAWRARRRARGSGG